MLTPVDEECKAVASSTSSPELAESSSTGRLDGYVAAFTST
jgi:hypothetical protein